MAHVRKDTLTKPNSGTSWWKHLRPFGKRAQAQKERAAAKRDIAARLND
jgi:hypothetical protein